MTITNEAGLYVMPNLALGPYRLQAALQGFRTFVQTGILLQVNSSPVINVVLNVGQVTEAIEVQANAVTVEMRSLAVGQVIDNQRIIDLPLNGRDVTDLIPLSGAAVQINTAARANKGISLHPEPMFQVAGGLGYATNYTLDGAGFTNPSSGGPYPFPFPDALQEFKVDTSGASIDQGRASGMSAVSKSGTNQLHGDVFEFLRNDLFSARPYFAKAGSTLKRNQFGGVLGGAIKKDKLFFFAGYQETLLRQNNQDQETFLPTPAMLAGDFTTFASPACNGSRQITLRPPFAGNRIDPAQFSKTGLGIVMLTLAQAPPQDDDCGHVRFGRPVNVNEYQGVGRLDYHLNDKHTIFGRYQILPTIQPNAYEVTPNNVLNAPAGGLDNWLQNLALGSTYVFGPTTVNSFRISTNWWKIRSVGANTFSVCDAQSFERIPVTYYCGNAPHRTTISVTNGPSLGGGQYPYSPSTNLLHTLSDDLSLVRGAHQISVGFTGEVSRNLSNYHALDVMRLTIAGAVTGTGLSDLLTGRLTQMIQTGENRFDTTSQNIAAYFVDTWKARPRLTVSMSLRWDPSIMPYLKYGGIANFDYDRFNKGTTTQQYKFAPSGWYYPGDPGHPGWRGSNNKLWNFAPRLGLAWDPTGAGRTSIRASFAYTYSPVLNFWRQDPADQNPWVNATRLVSPVGGLDNPWQGYSYVDPVSGAVVSGIPFPSVFGRGFTNDGDYTSTSYDMNRPQASTWNLSVQRQFGKDWLVSASYLGSTTTHIWMQEQGNPARIISPLPPGGAATCGALPVTQCSGQDNAQFRRALYLARPNDTIRQGVVALLDDTGTMSYNGLVLSAEKRLSKGTSVQTNYTWSHCLADAIDVVADGPDAGESNVIPGNRRFDRGQCPGDRRHIFNLTGIAQMPRFAGNRTLDWIASGWQLSGIYRRSSGPVINILAGSDRALTGQLGFFAGQAYQRADQILPDNQAYTPGAGGPMTFWLNPAAFRVPALGTFGNYYRNNLTYVPEWSFDMALSRTFRVSESNRFEIRAEAFNLTNSFRPGPPPASVAVGSSNFNTVSSSTFGQIRTASDPRIMQFALKYVF
ncbi:MAG: hypothetical protein DMG16_03670 [Acidobacteria bacterium]|nr:MAG: hypothetical protein DMG16_03670 [Acidobacteriota bacterium]